MNALAAEKKKKEELEGDDWTFIQVWCEDEDDGLRYPCALASSRPRITRNEGSFRKLAQAG